MRLAAIAHSGFSTLRFGDAHAYLDTALTLARTGRYPLRTDYGSFRAPGYPAFLLVATLGDPRRVPMAKAANAVLGAVSVLLLMALSLRLFRHRGVALATGAAAALDPSLVLHAADLQSEPLFLTLLLTSAFLLIVCVDRPSSNAGLLAGAALALAALTRPSALALTPLLAAPLLDRRHPLRARAHLAASALLGLALAMLPWTLRNALIYREILPVNDFAGVTLYLGNSDLISRYYAIRTGAEYEAWLRDLKLLTNEKESELAAEGATTPSQRLRAYVRMAAEESLARPGETARRLGLKAWHWLRPYPTPWFWPLWTVFAAGAFYLALDVLAAAGLVTSARRGVALFCAGVLLLSMLAHVLLLVVWRYRVPYWDPILLLYAPPGARRLWNARSGVRPAPPVALADGT